MSAVSRDARAAAEANYLLAQLLFVRACQRSLDKPESEDRLRQAIARKNLLAAAEASVTTARNGKRAK